MEWPGQLSECQLTSHGSAHCHPSSRLAAHGRAPKSWGALVLQLQLQHQAPLGMRLTPRSRCDVRDPAHGAEHPPATRPRHWPTQIGTHWALNCTNQHRRRRRPERSSSGDRDLVGALGLPPSPPPPLGPPSSSPSLPTPSSEGGGVVQSW